MRSREGRKDERSALKRNGARGSTLIGGVIHVFVFGTRSTDPDYHNCKVGGSRQRDRRRRSGTPIRLFTNRPPPTFWSPVQPRFRLSVNLPPCRLDRELETTINGQLRRRSKDKHYRRLGKVTRPADLFARLGKSISKYIPGGSVHRASVRGTIPVLQSERVYLRAPSSISIGSRGR